MNRKITLILLLVFAAGFFAGFFAGRLYEKDETIKLKDRIYELERGEGPQSGSARKREAGPKKDARGKSVEPWIPE